MSRKTTQMQDHFVNKLEVIWWRFKIQLRTNSFISVIKNLFSYESIERFYTKSYKFFFQTCFLIRNIWWKQLNKLGWISTQFVYSFKRIEDNRENISTNYNWLSMFRGFQLNRRAIKYWNLLLLNFSKTFCCCCFTISRKE